MLPPHFTYSAAVFCACFSVSSYLCRMCFFFVLSACVELSPAAVIRAFFVAFQVLSATLAFLYVELWPFVHVDPFPFVFGASCAPLAFLERFLIAFSCTFVGLHVVIGMFTRWSACFHRSFHRAPPLTPPPPPLCYRAP